MSIAFENRVGISYLGGLGVVGKVYSACVYVAALDRLLPPELNLGDSGCFSCYISKNLNVPLWPIGESSGKGKSCSIKAISKSIYFL